MEKIKKIEDAWKSNKKLVKPKILIAIDNYQEMYFVYEDNSTIIYLVGNKSNITYCIVKSYTEEIKDKEGFKYYKINNNENLIQINCKKKNEYQLFVQNKLIN